MAGKYDLGRFLSAQEYSYESALREIKAGRKTSHWIWYIFPQLKGLGYSFNAELYGIDGIGEAEEYLAHPVLSQRLVEISRALLSLECCDPYKVMGAPDDMKLRSSMTLFSCVKNADPVFDEVLEKFFDGKKDTRTLEMLGKKDMT